MQLLTPSAYGMACNALTHYQNDSREEIHNHTILPDELNEFYAQLEALSTEPQKRVMESWSTQKPPFTISSVDVSKKNKPTISSC